MQTLVTVIHLLSTLFLVIVILLQPGKSGSMGAFGGNTSAKIFGAQGATHVLAKATMVAGFIFIVTSLSLAIMSSGRRSVVSNYPVPAAASKPASSPAP